MRLIDGSFLEERCEKQMSDKWNKEASPCSWADAYEQFLTDIENCATIDAVPVVRCRECKWRTVLDTAWHPCTEMSTNDNWFCADGK